MKSTNITLKTVNYSVTGGITYFSRELLSKEGISPEPLYGLVKTVVIKLYNMNIQGISIGNDNGGMEFYAPSHFEKPITLLRDYTTILPYHRKEKSECCCLFYDMLDYFAYRTFLYNKVHLDSLPSYCDCVIINKPLNFLNATIEAESYNLVYSFLPADDTGISMYKTLCDRNPQKIKDLSFIYKNRKSLINQVKKDIKL